MHKEPYCWHQPELKELPFQEFLTNSIEDYQNPIVMWNEKYRSYIRFNQEVPHSCFVKFEDFATDQLIVHDQLSQFMNPKGDFRTLDIYVSGKGINQNRPIPSKEQMHDFSDEEMAILKSFVDQDLLDFFITI